MMLLIEIIAEARAVSDVVGIWTKFLAETCDMNIDGAIGNESSCPYCIHELLAGA